MKAVILAAGISVLFLAALLGMHGCACSRGHGGILREGFDGGRRREEDSAPVVPAAIAALMRRPVDLPLWLDHHRRMGVQRFYIRLEDTPGWAGFLRAQPDVWFEEGDSDKTGNNYETLMHRQIAFVNKILRMAPQDGVRWVFHTDADELLEGSLGFLASLPSHVHCLKVENVEAVYGDDEPTCFSAKRFIRCSAGGPCLSYVNMKAAGRAVPEVTLIGPHDFGYNGQIDDRHTYRVPFDTLRLLHFDSCTFSSWAEKFQHLSKKAKTQVIPFPYYRESIEVASRAFDVYRKHKMRTDLSPSVVYQRA